MEMIKLALEKTGYTAANQGTTKVKVGTDADGYIAPSGDTAAGARNISINKVSAENSLQDNTEVLGFFLNLANGVQDSMSNQMTVTWGV